MSDELREQIYNELNLRETYDLLEIWQTNNRTDWSDTAFEVIKEILNRRIGEVPPQDELIGEEAKEEILELDGLDEWEVNALDNENQPEFYDVLEVITIKDNINKTLKAVIVVNALVGLASFQWFNGILGSYFPNREEVTPLIFFIALILLGLSTAVNIAIIYYPLKALSHILRILMEMEFNSRKVS